MPTVDNKNRFNNFIEKNLWIMLSTLVGITIVYTTISFKVEAQEDRIKTLEEAQIIQVENQKEIIKLQINQQNNIDIIKEIQADVKILLRR